MQTPENIVIVGNGQAGIQLVDSLRKEGHTGPITLLGEETHHPYQRPPLSKDYLAAGKDPVPLPLRPGKFFTTNDVDARLGVHVTSIDRAARTVTLDDGTTLEYSKLVLATGAANRGLTVPGGSLAGIHGLRTLTDAQALHARLDAVRSVVVIGAGFIGLEFAAAARHRGLDVTVLEFADRPMGRAVSAGNVGFFADAHQRTGVTLRLGEGIASFDGREGHGAVSAPPGSRTRPIWSWWASASSLAPNSPPPPDWKWRTASWWTAACAPPTRTSTPSATARPSPATSPAPGRGWKSVQNATDQARHAARAIVGTSAQLAAEPAATPGCPGSGPSKARCTCRLPGW